MTSEVSKEDYLVVRDAVWLLRLRAVFVLGVSGLIACHLRDDPGSSTFYWTLILVFAVGGITMMAGTFNPQTRLVVDKTGIWVPGYETVEWQQLAGFYSSEYQGTEELATSFVFVTHDSQDINVSLDAADSGSDTVRQYIKQLNTNVLLRDHGQK